MFADTWALKSREAEDDPGRVRIILPRSVGPSPEPRLFLRARERDDFLNFAKQLLYRRAARYLCTDPEVLEYRFRNASRHLDAYSTLLYGEIGEIMDGADACAPSVSNEGLVREALFFALRRSSVRGEGGNYPRTAAGGVGRCLAQTSFPHLAHGV